MTYPFLSEDTITAISTPPGPGAIGMVRISGPQAHRIGREIFSPLGGKNRPFPSRQAIFGKVHPPGRQTDPIDLAVLCFFAGPGTYTGEDTVEITAHGGPLIMRSVLDAAVAGGARLAEPGEFTRRAFMNGRMDLSQAEAVASLIFASTEEARAVMLRQVEGAMSEEARTMRDCLLKMKVNLEASIDFPEDVEEPDRDDLLDIVGKVHEIAGRLAGTAGRGIALGEGFRVVITGAPNVGKSCLLNALLEEERSIVHEIAGTTRDYVEGTLNLGGVPVKVVDTAGIRGTSEPVEYEGVKRARRQIGVADVVIIVLDSSRAIRADEEMLLADTDGLKRIIAANKSDIECASEFMAPEGAVQVSALRGDGIGVLKRLIKDTYFGNETAAGLERGVATTARQAEALEKMKDSTERIGADLRDGATAELIAVGVDEALEVLAELTGEVTTEEVLGEIFSRFCIGK